MVSTRLASNAAPYAARCFSPNGGAHSFLSKCETSNRRIDVLELIQLVQLYEKPPQYFSLSRLVSVIQALLAQINQFQPSSWSYAANSAKAAWRSSSARRLYIISASNEHGDVFRPFDTRSFPRPEVESEKDGRCSACSLLPVW